MFEAVVGFIVVVATMLILLRSRKKLSTKVLHTIPVNGKSSSSSSFDSGTIVLDRLVHHNPNAVSVETQTIEIAPVAYLGIRQNRYGMHCLALKSAGRTRARYIEVDGVELIQVHHKIWRRPEQGFRGWRETAVSLVEFVEERQLSIWDFDKPEIYRLDRSVVSSED